MANTRDKPSQSAAPLELGFDPTAMLVKEPRLLLESRFLGALHAELEAEKGSEGAAATLLQIGFLHGLQDASRALRGAFTGPRGDVGAPVVPPLAIRCRSNPRALPPGAIEIDGHWPDHAEASARLSFLGPSASVACYVSGGYTSGWLSGLFEADLLAVELGCSATGEAACRFVAREPEAWRALAHADAIALLDALPFEALRRLVRTEGEPLPEIDSPEFDREAAVVHIWGPVMVVPYAGPDEVMKAIDLLGSDPSARDVSVVVIDLAGAVIDDAFGAAALEEIIAAIEDWGADSIFAEVSPLSERVVLGLERQPLMIQKNLEEAIAAGFRVAEAQARHV